MQSQLSLSFQSYKSLSDRHLFYLSVGDDSFFLKSKGKRFCVPCFYLFASNLIALYL